MRTLRAALLLSLLSVFTAGCSENEVAMMGDHPGAIGALDADPTLVRDKSGVPPRTAPEGMGRGGSASEPTDLVTR